MTIGKFYRPKPGAVTTAFNWSENKAPTVFAQKTNKKQGGTMFTVQPQTAKQLESKQQITYSRAGGSR